MRKENKRQKEEEMARSRRRVRCVDVCTGLSSAWPGPRAEPGPGSTDDLRVRAGFGRGSNYSNQTFSQLFGLSRAILFRKENVIRSFAHIMLVTQSGSGNKSHRLDFLGDLRRCPLPEVVRDNTLETWHPICLYRFSNAKITSDVLRASLNNSFKDYWHLFKKMY
jgi:hypothetical protein